MEQTQLHAQVKRMRGGLIVSNLPRSGGNSEDEGQDGQAENEKFLTTEVVTLYYRAPELLRWSN